MQDFVDNPDTWKTSHRAYGTGVGYEKGGIHIYRPTWTVNYYNVFIGTALYQIPEQYFVDVHDTVTKLQVRAKKADEDVRKKQAIEVLKKQGFL